MDGNPALPHQADRAFRAMPRSWLERLSGQPSQLTWQDDFAPVKSEIFGMERLEAHARSLAAAQTITPRTHMRGQGHSLARRLADNGAFLRAADERIAEALQAGKQLTPAAQWLADNYALVDMQIREIALDLPPRYYARLPKLASGPFAGLPRVFGVTWALVAHTDSNIQPETLYNYLLAYQGVTPLTIGELWAVPITLRIVLIENLRRVVSAIMANNASRREADMLADSLDGYRKDTPSAMAAFLATVDPGVLNGAFIAQLAHRSRGLDPEKDPALVWLGQRLADRGTSIEDAVRDDLQEQGTFNATIRNIITSLRLIAGFDWTEAFDHVCLVNRIFDSYPSFTQADFASRDLYRKAIEDLARGSDHSEMAIAELSVSMARRAAAVDGHDPRRADPGYYLLLMAGRRELEAAIGFRPPLSSQMVRLFCARGIAAYSIVVTLLTLLFLAVPLWLTSDGASGMTWLLAVLAFVPVSEAAVACVNRLALEAIHATALPGLEFRDGVPATLRSMVVVPALMTTEETLTALLARLEVHYLATRDDSVHFALLTDWTDFHSPDAPDDQRLLDLALDRVAGLNRKYGPAPGGMRFYVLHRRRTWSESEQVWMGWERKRGKLHELNRLLRGATDTTYLAPAAPLPANVRYIITLDADTRLPLETVCRLIGKMAHPLNAPAFDPVAGRVREGYAILQPRVTPSLPVGHHSTLFQRIFASASGIDAYSAAVSDLYQDMFGEGSYAGKGIYDIDAFEAALAGRVPESTLLSHDLFEGIFARAGLATDVEVVEDFPTDYLVAAQRMHRWTRGDWQLLPWIMSGIARRNAPVRDRFSGIALWKMLDNLRRTLVTPLALVALVAGWFLPLHAAVVWTAFVLLGMALPAFLPVLPDIIPRREWITLRGYLSVIGAKSAESAVMTFLNVTFLAHQACLMGDAISRTLVRVFITRRHMLQWVPAAQIAGLLRSGLAGYYGRMSVAPLLAGGITLCVAIWAPWSLFLAVPVAVLWCFSPAVAMWASRTHVIAARSRPSRTDIRTLRMTARRTWRFFETFTTPADHMLPPDNFQEDPSPVLARRTSPTNIGLYLLCTASAHDFGWTGLADTVSRLEATFSTLETMPRYRGHFYNWYATDDLRPLEPIYVSSVDSGNMAGHLIALASACQGWQHAGPETDTWREGIADALNIAIADLTFDRGVRQSHTAAERQLLRLLTGLKNAVLSTPGKSTAELAALHRHAAGAAEHVARMHPDVAAGGTDRIADRVFWVTAPLRALESHMRDLDTDLHATLASRLETIAQKARTMAQEMDFHFLCNPSRKLLSIGYLVAEDTQDTNCYDLLASEARLAVFFAIAKGDMPAHDWFRLGRSITPVRNGAALVSWSGSMFEYLMPSLVMRAPVGSLLEQTNGLIVQRQIAYGQTHDIPWGVSESAYNVRDLDYTYQYSNFGVPGLGFKRGLGLDRVVAPYATMLAAMVDPQKAVANLYVLEKTGALGQYGFYESLDFTPDRVPDQGRVAIVRAYMAHHQGMSILAVADAIMNGVMRTRFHSDPVVASAELLLQERAPRTGAVARPLPFEEDTHPTVHAVSTPAGRYLERADTPQPVTHLLSNGRYTVMLTAAGSGYSRWNGQAITRWREDTTCDDYGSYLYLKNRRTGQVWSAGVQPCGPSPEEYAVAFHEDRAEFARRDGTLTTRLEVLVSAENDAEVRQLSLFNAGSDPLDIDVTSYMELALLAQAGDLAHPAFTKLFVHTEYLHAARALIATRRRRTPDEAEIWVAHLVVCSTAIEVETDRACFLGRERTVHRPVAVMGDGALSGHTGNVLDPIFSIRVPLSIRPGTMGRIAFWTMAAPSREALLDLIDTHRDHAAFERVRTLAWTQAQVQLRHLDITPATADLFQRLAGHILFAGPALRASPPAIAKGAGAQPLLWEQGISGDLPILVLRIREASNTAIVRLLLLAHEYFRLKQVAVDFVVLNEHPSSYLQELQAALDQLVHSVTQSGGNAGTVRVLRADLLTPAMRDLILSVARVVLVADRGLAEQLDYARVPARRTFLPTLAPTPSPASAFAAPPVPELEFFNGHGGFARNGQEYVIVLAPGQTTPAPWINVITNDTFGFQVSGEGSGYTWSGSSREHQITPWSNDPVSNHAGEIFYIRDESTGMLWCPVAAVRRDRAATYVTTHGRGYTRQERIAHGVASTLLQYVPVADPVKITRIQLRNLSDHSRTLSITAYVEWVLGRARSTSAAFVSTELDEESGTLFARNPWSADYGNRVAFADIGGYLTASSGDRTAFVGRNGTVEHPAAFAHADGVQGRTGAGLDPCGVVQTVVILPPGGKAEIVFLLGEGADINQARDLVARYRTVDLDGVLRDVRQHWDRITQSVQVRTPDRSMDIMLNGWLLYQTLASRVQARAGFYQASGAYGFRDQLQDGMALVLSRPDLVRAHLLRAASRQFVEGDVQHWWLPQTGAGVRTHISDDRAWLAYTVAHYVATSGDTGVLDESLPFLVAPPLPITEHDRFTVPTISDESGSLFEHCARALDHSLVVGAHGLPLMGTGDWNDGMNRVGEHGKGESVWLGWFLHATLNAFIPLARARGDLVRARAWEDHARALAVALEKTWDGDWYLRAYFDDGTPLGSHISAECQIDAISQSWAVLSGVASPERAEHAMGSVLSRLVRQHEGLILVLAPPFDTTGPDPGYIRGYPPGIRENGGQYTHAALWTVMAVAALGDGDRAQSLFHTLTPINHALNTTEAARYRLEPYVIAADVYSQPPHVGRGGWSWYTGSAGWMQRVGIETILGIRVHGTQLRVDPCIPHDWPCFEVTLRWRSAVYNITVLNPAHLCRGIGTVSVDGVSIPATGSIDMLDDGNTHAVEVSMG